MMCKNLDMHGSVFRVLFQFVSFLAAIWTKPVPIIKVNLVDKFHHTMIFKGRVTCKNNIFILLAVLEPWVECDFLSQ